MVRASAHNANAYPVALIPTGKSIDNVDTVPGVEIIDSTLTVDTPDLVVWLAMRGNEMVGHVMNCNRRAWRDAGEPRPKRATCKDENGKRLNRVVV